MTTPRDERNPLTQVQDDRTASAGEPWTTPDLVERPLASFALQSQGAGVDAGQFDSTSCC